MLRGHAFGLRLGEGRLFEFDLQRLEFLTEILTAFVGPFEPSLAGPVSLLGHLSDAAQSLEGRLQTRRRRPVPVERLPQHGGLGREPPQLDGEFADVPVGPFRPSGEISFLQPRLGQS